jgi:hypothetical protein
VAGGRERIERQLADMEAQGLGETAGVHPGAAVPEPTRVAEPGRREPWRLVVAGALTVLAVVLFVVGVRLDRVGPDWEPLHAFGVLLGGLVAAVAALTWWWNQLRPKPRTYTRRGVVQSLVAAALIPVVGGLWYGAGTPSGTAPLILLVVLVMLLADTITRTTGPDAGRRVPTRVDPRLAAYRAITPFPVTLAVTLAYCGWALAQLVG